MKIAQLITDDREPTRQYDLPAPYFGTAPTALLEGFAKMPGVEVHIVSCSKRPMVSPEKLAPNIYFHSVIVPSIGWLKTGYQGCIRAARRKLHELQPDIVHGQGCERDQNISAVLSGFPNVITIHGNMRLVARLMHARPFSFHWLAARLEAFTIPRAGGVVCITSYTREAVASLARRTWLLPNAVDSAFFDIVAVPSPTRRILCVGMVDGRKNQIALIRALDTVSRPPDLELLFLGGIPNGSEYGREFLKLVAERPWCRYGGFANRKTLREYFTSAHGLVLPSLEDNCPMVVLEAMASGVPVAAANVGGVPDLVRDGETGVLFDPLDPASIAQGMTQLFSTGPGSPMAVRARKEARARFHPDVVAARHLEIYREVLAAPKGA